MSSRTFSTAQYGVESTAGTAVAATKKWTGKVFSIPLDRKIVMPEEDIAVRMKSRRATVQQRAFAFSTISEHAIYQQLKTPLEAMLKGGVTMSEVTPAQSDYLGTWTPSLTAANSQKKFTWEFGDETIAKRAEYCMAQRMHLSTQIQQSAEPSPVKLEVDWIGRQALDNALTGSLAHATPTGMNGKLSRLYIDTAWSGVGGTEITGLKGWDLEILSGQEPDWYGSANEYFDSHHEGYFGAMLTFKIDNASVAAAKYLLAQAATFQCARLDVVGPVIGSGTSHRLRFDLGGMLEESDLNSEEDRANNLSTFKLQAIYDDTGAKSIQCAMTTNTSAY